MTVCISLFTEIRKDAVERRESIGISGLGWWRTDTNPILEHSSNFLQKKCVKKKSKASSIPTNIARTMNYCGQMKNYPSICNRRVDKTAVKSKTQSNIHSIFKISLKHPLKSFDKLLKSFTQRILCRKSLNRQHQLGMRCSFSIWSFSVALIRCRMKGTSQQTDCSVWVFIQRGKHSHRNELKSSTQRQLSTNILATSNKCSNLSSH